MRMGGTSGALPLDTITWTRNEQVLPILLVTELVSRSGRQPPRCPP